MTKQDIENKALELMAQHGLSDWNFKFITTKRVIGRCTYSKKLIQYSVNFLDNTEAEIKDTLLHEIAHALVGYNHGHDKFWKDKASEIGAIPKACKNSSSRPKGKYTLLCHNCGERLPMYRKPKRERSCGKCGNGKYNEALKLEVIQNY